MGEERGTATPLGEHGATIAKVAMALLGDPREVERVLEEVARERASKRTPDGTKELVWLLGVVRSACAVRTSQLPLRGDEPPRTERLASAATDARTRLGAVKPTEREAIVLHLVGGLDAEGVAAACGIDLDTARTRIARGIVQMMESAKGGPR